MSQQLLQGFFNIAARQTKHTAALNSKTQKALQQAGR
jgi:hypothetical protein